MNDGIDRRNYQDRTIASVTHEVSAELKRLYSWTPLGIVQAEGRDSSSCSHIVLMRFRNERGEHRVYVKIPNETPSNRSFVSEWIETEYRVLEKLTEVFAEYPDLGVVRPLAIARESRALATEETPGPTLQHLIGTLGRMPRSAWTTPHLASLCRRAGEWLRVFHDATRRPSAEAKWDETVAYCERRLKLLLDAPDGMMDSQTADRVRQALIDNIQALRGTPLIVAGRHNDFAPHNIIVGNNEKLTVLDFTMFDYDSVAFDVYNFIHKIESQCQDLLFRRTTSERLIAAFVQGYGHGFPAEGALKTIVYCRLNLAKLYSLVGERPSNPAKRLMFRRLQCAYLDWLRQVTGPDQT